MKTNEGLYKVGQAIRGTKNNIPWDKIESSLEFQVACSNNDVEEDQIEYIRRGYLGLPFDNKEPEGIITIKGKFEGCKISQAPIAYLKWALTSAVIETKPELKQQIIEYLKDHD